MTLAVAEVYTQIVPVGDNVANTSFATFSPAE
jgi:hypothetical protein